MFELDLVWNNISFFKEVRHKNTMLSYLWVFFKWKFLFGSILTFCQEDKLMCLLKVLINSFFLDFMTQKYNEIKEKITAMSNAHF